MPKPTESMDVNQYTRHKSYAYHNNLHHDAHRSTGPVLSVFGAEPRSASAPAQHEGEGILALLDPREPPCHYFAVVTQEFLTLSPLMMKGAVVSKKAYGSRKYSGVEGSTKLDMKLVNSAKDEVARALETTANICLEEMKTAEEQGVKAARRSSRAVARKVKEKALAASDSAERLHQAMLDKKAGRRASSTVATPKTAAVVDTRLRHALNPAAVAPDAPSDAPFDYFPSAEVVRIPLAQVRQVRTCPTILRRRALEEQEADFGREIDFEHKYSLDNFEFEDPTLETHSIRVTVTVERRQPFDFITYKEGSVLPDELLSAHRVALARLVLRLPPSNVIETEVAALRMTHGFDVAPGEADANDARLLVADLERSLCGGHDAEPESDSDDDDAVRTLRQRERDAKREQLLQRRGAELMRPDLPQRHRPEDLPRRRSARRPRSRVQVEMLRRQAGYAPVDDADLLFELEGDMQVDVALKRAFFKAPKLIRKLVSWIEHIGADVDAVATVSLGERDDGDDHDSLSAGSLDHSNRVRDAQLAVATRGLAAVRFLRAALHDSRGVSERFRLLRTHKLTPERIVDACSADHFNHTDHRDDAADARLRHDARVARHQAQHWTPHAFHLPSERKRRDANRELLAKSRENFLRNHLTPFFQNPVDAPTGETPDSRLETPKARLAFHPSTKGLERRDDASPADLAEAVRRLATPSSKRETVSYRQLQEAKEHGEALADVALRLATPAAARRKTALLQSASRSLASPGDGLRSAAKNLAGPAAKLRQAARLVVDDDDDASVASSASRAPSSVSQASSGSSALFLAAQRMQRDEEAKAADKSDRLRRTLKEAADLEAAEDAKTSDAAARLVASLGRADSVKTLESGSSSLGSEDLGAAVNDAPPPPSSSSSGPYAEETAFFVKDRDAAIAYSDIPPRPGARPKPPPAVALFARLLDAQADLLVEIDELTSARFREDDPPIWVDMGQRQMGPHWVLSSVAADDARASPLLCALVERCISLGLSISRTGPSLPSPSKRARARQVTAVGDLRSPRAGDRSSRGATEPALALLACSHLLLGLLQASYVMREIAASECADEVDDFLLRDEFYDALEANRVTRLAASNLREATRVIRQGEETAKAAHRKQRGGDITHT
ncbi:hypothetical protein AURANDRAFT_61749 [Aureococcus anophagefferens]|uniref:Uncharacterized protein n=1 Tax=Aureococcus anophagefferens TaxID=44056 RepID=F0XZI1_AURAN|nr:hypothetical protein AURANDRAFT_61749 [Aureococcus anophagefferens]EGB11347.1 hypothetical protein AURANDRAFT_61749 [Aureococcus anophagefferens]|eukprot:XP_009033725.1 hypothetical protein AURANDRAFT_61749 [Aureococcus anophagefferens]